MRLSPDRRQRTKRDPTAVHRAQCKCDEVATHPNVACAERVGGGRVPADAALLAHDPTGCIAVVRR